MSKRTKRILAVILCLVVLCNLSVFFVGYIIFNGIVDTESDFSPRNLGTTFHNLTHPFDRIEPTSKEVDTSPWFHGKSEDVYINSYDNLKLHAYKVKNTEPNANGNYVLLVHGYGGTGRSMTTFAGHFYKSGYHLLSVDLRANGQSEGRYIGFGWLDRLDILEWVNFITSESPNAKIVLFGVSMGGAAVMNTTGEALADNVVAAIEDSGFSVIFDEIERLCWNTYHFVPLPFLYVSSVVSEIKAGYSFKDASCLTQLQKSKTPTLFIHGTADTVVPHEMLALNYNACASEKQKLSVEGAGHIGSVQTDEELYWRTVDEFLEKYI
ncbi:MAG: alpha/beta hydrolase [Acutalibacteraceae bacterium]